MEEYSLSIKGWLGVILCRALFALCDILKINAVFGEIRMIDPAVTSGLALAALALTTASLTAAIGRDGVLPTRESSMHRNTCM
jgi:hypothetical protein